MLYLQSLRNLALILGLTLALVATTFAQSTSFTYQGKLTDNSVAANGTYQMQFGLYDGSNAQIGSTVNAVVPVANGIFTVTLDFGTGAFPGAGRFLQINVLSPTTSTFIPLTPRQPFTSAPYSVRSLSAGTADTALNSLNSQQLGGIASDLYVLTLDPRMTDAREPFPGSNSYIQNATNQQPASFKITGTGGADIFDAATQYNLGGHPILTTPGDFNLVVGQFAGGSLTAGKDNTFFGFSTGQQVAAAYGNSFFGSTAGEHDTGADNSFFGSSSGRTNTAGYENAFFGGYSGGDNDTGSRNAFFGFFAGRKNTSGSYNTFFGSNAGASNLTALNNSFFGQAAGLNTDTGADNTFLGNGAGLNNKSGQSNTFSGGLSGQNNSTGVGNSFYGNNAGSTNTTGSNNTIIGTGANVLGTNLGFATAIGAGSIVNASNTVALGRSDGSDKVVIYGLGSAGSTQLCRNASNQIATCSSSLRYKTNINAFTQGVDLVKRLRPITFNWKDGGMADLGFGAEDVAAVEPLLVIHNDKGQVEGVKYDRITAVLVNAVKEQQAQIDRQNALIASLEARLTRVETHQQKTTHRTRRSANAAK